MLTENKWIQYGFPREKEDIKCIILHNTGNTFLSAKDLFDYLQNECKTSQGCHYLIDHEGVIQVMPNEWAVYNTGKGLDYGNQYGIAIEICDNLSDELYQEGQNKAIQLVKDLMGEYGIKDSEIYFHNDFAPRTYCPHILLDRYGTSTNFVYQEIKEV